MAEKRKVKDIIAKPIKEYKLPLIDRIAYYRPFFVWLFWLAVTAMIVAPTIYKNYTNFWYYLLLVPLIFFFVKSVIGYCQFCVYSFKYHEIMAEDAEGDDSYENHMGAPGTGKSFVAKERIYAKAMNSWDEIQFEYWCISSRLKDPKYVPTEEEQEIIDAYEFYSKHNGIPCMATSIPCYSKRFKRFSYELELGHLKQEKRLPFRCCLFQDEIGTAYNFSTAWSVYAKEGNGEVDIDDFARFIRQFGEFRLIGTEQDGGNIAIFLKRIASDNKRFDNKKWVLKPRFLFWIYSKLKQHFVRRMRYSEAKMFGKFMQNFKKFIFSCGFFKFTYTSCGNFVTQSKTETIVINMKEKKTRYYFPRASEVVYKTRAFRRAYKPLGKPIELDVFTDLDLTVGQAKAMLKSENLSVKKKVENQKKTTSEVLQF